MIKLLLPLISFFMGSAQNLFKGPGVALTQQLVLHIRSLSLILISSIGSLTLLCVGLSLLINRVASQFDAEEEFYFTTGMWIYLGMSLVAAVLLVLSLKKDTWLKAVGFSSGPAKAAPQSGAIENAVALLIMDFVEERQNRRKQKEP